MSTSVGEKLTCCEFPKLNIAFLNVFFYNLVLIDEDLFIHVQVPKEKINVGSCEYTTNKEKQILESNVGNNWGGNSWPG